MQQCWLQESVNQALHRLGYMDTGLFFAYVVIELGIAGSVAHVAQLSYGVLRNKTYFLVFTSTAKLNNEYFMFANKLLKPVITG